MINSTFFVVFCYLGADVYNMMGLLKNILPLKKDHIRFETVIEFRRKIIGPSGMSCNKRNILFLH